MSCISHQSSHLFRTYVLPTLIQHHNLYMHANENRMWKLKWPVLLAHTLNASKDATTLLPHMFETIPSHQIWQCSSLLCLHHQPERSCHCNASTHHVYQRMSLGPILDCCKFLLIFKCLFFKWIIIKSTMRKMPFMSDKLFDKHFYWYCCSENISKCYIFYHQIA